MEKLSLLIKESYIYKALTILFFKVSVSINPKYEINRNYYARFKKNPNLDDPRNLIEKIYWLQLHTDTSLWSICADKYRMREYVKEKGCEEYLPQILGVWEKPKMIEWEKLPRSFVLKTNNGCGTVLVVHDKNVFTEKSVKKKLKKWLSLPYGYSAYQPHYLKIRPCVLAEELLIQDSYLNELSTSIVDFKIWCLNGEVESCFVAYNRTRSELFVDLYDSNWTRLLNCIQNSGMDRIAPDKAFPKPLCWEEMKWVAEKLSKPFPEVRIDFYIVNNKPIIGEMTFSSGYGYFTEDYYDYLGAKLDLSKQKVIK